ncbi:MAG TPA: hypothetical protein VEA69_16820 [Tepidisphaeraceae bacterium]|nr:hypothetical protein [Tepidisphaeraceae bacterium]
MPIRPENKARYPKDWKAIRARILARAGDRCEWCGVANYAMGTRDKSGKFHEMGAMEAESAHLDGEKVVRIVLTIAHVHDPAPENCADDNLAALCQRCHNRHDAPERLRGRRERQAANTGPLFGEEVLRGNV